MGFGGGLPSDPGLCSDIRPGTGWDKDQLDESLLLAELSEGLSLCTLRMAVRRYSSHKALGADLWEVGALRVLPDVVLTHFLGWLRLCQRQGCWPDGFRQNIMAMIPKPLVPDLRCVGKAPMLYRMWGACRREGVVSWETESLAPWDMSRKGVSALDVAYHRVVMAEACHATDMAFAAVLWDFEKFFDTLDTGWLIQEAVALGFPLVDLQLGLHMHLAPQTPVGARVSLGYYRARAIGATGVHSCHPIHPGVYAAQARAGCHREPPHRVLALCG